MASPITLRRTTVVEPELSSPEDIAAYLAQDYSERTAGARFAPSKRVRLKGRAGIVGDMAVVVWADTTFSQVLVAHQTSGVMVISIMTDNLAKWDA